MPRFRASRLRRRKRRLLARLHIPADGLPGSLALTHRRCGKPACHCAAAQGHPRWLLPFMQDGQKHLQQIPADYVDAVRPKVEAGRDFRPAVAEVFTINAERLALERKQASGPLGPARQIMLLAAARKPNQEIARTRGIPRQTAALGRGRFLEQGIAGIHKDVPRSGRPRTIPPDKIDEIVTKTTRQTPADATQWSTRSLAEATGLSPSTVGRIWRVHGLKPQRVKTFKLSHDPRFAEKLEDVVNLYLDPPPDSLVLSLDEKSQSQALDRTQPDLPWQKGRCGTLTHDYKRHGTTTLFAAMNVQVPPVPPWHLTTGALRRGLLLAVACSAFVRPHLTREFTYRSVLRSRAAERALSKLGEPSLRMLCQYVPSQSQINAIVLGFRQHATCFQIP